MTRATRQHPEIRRESILDAAITLAKKRGYNRITRDAVAEEAGVSSPLIAAYFPRMSHLRVAIMDTSINRQIVEIIAQGLTINDPMALNINEGLRKKVMTYLSKIK